MNYTPEMKSMPALDLLQADIRKLWFGLKVQLIKR